MRNSTLRESWWGFGTVAGIVIAILSASVASLESWWWILGINAGIMIAITSRGFHQGTPLTLSAGAAIIVGLINAIIAAIAFFKTGNLTNPLVQVAGILLLIDVGLFATLATIFNKQQERKT